MSIEFPIILVVIAFLVIHQLLEALRQRNQLPSQKPERQTTPPPFEPTEPPAMPVGVAPHPTFDATPAPEPTVVAAPAVRFRRRPRSARLHDTAELHRAIVLMTILEPCRAIAELSRTRVARP